MKWRKQMVRHAVLYESQSRDTVWTKLKADLGESPGARAYESMLSSGLFRGDTGALHFVGTLNGADGDTRYSIQVFPKYMDTGDGEQLPGTEQMRLLQKVIQKSGHFNDYENTAKFDTQRYNQDRKRVGRDELAEWLMNDYIGNGAFAIREKHTTRLPRGSIRWNRTILKTTPAIDGDDSVYLSPIRSYVRRNDQLLLSDIHRCAVHEAIEYLGAAEAGVQEPVYRAEYLGRLREYVPLIRSFQRVVFTQRDITLLRCLETWCLEESRYYRMPIGTVSFELVWEDVLRSVFGHRGLDQKVGFGAPQYNILGRPYALNGDSIPDGLNFWTDKESGELRFLILDGKYYLGRVRDSATVTNLPGYKDVAKQIDYFETLRSIYGLNPGCGKNVFILPWWNIPGAEGIKDQAAAPLCGGRLEVRYIGYAVKPKAVDPIKGILKNLGHDLPAGAASESGTVHLIQIDPDSLYRVYLSNDAVQEKAASELWNYIQDSFFGNKCGRTPMAQ